MGKIVGSEKMDCRGSDGKGCTYDSRRDDEKLLPGEKVMGCEVPACIQGRVRVYQFLWFKHTRDHIDGDGTLTGVPFDDYGRGSSPKKRLKLVSDILPAQPRKLSLDNDECLGSFD